MKNTKNKSNKIGDKLLHSGLQIASGLGGAFANRVLCNVLTNDSPMGKAIVSGGMSVGLFGATFLKMPPLVEDLFRGFAYGSIFETANRYIVKPIEKTEFGMKYFNGDDESVIRLTQEQYDQLNPPTNGEQPQLPENTAYAEETTNGEEDNNDYPNGEEDEEDYTNGEVIENLRPMIM